MRLQKTSPRERRRAPWTQRSEGTCTMLALLTYPEIRQRQGPRARGAGPRAHARGGRRYRPPKGSSLCRGLRRKRLASRFYRSFQAMPRPEPTRPKRSIRFRRINSGGAEAGRVSRAAASSDARPGLCKAERCGGASGKLASGNTRGPPPPDCSPRTRKKPPQSWPSCERPRLGRWFLWRPRRNRRGVFRGE